MIYNLSSKVLILFTAAAFLICCSSSSKIGDNTSNSDVNGGTYTNPSDYQTPLSIQKIEQINFSDSTFVPVRVKGGMRKAFRQVVYPPEAQKKNITGRVILKVYVNSAANLDSIEVIQPQHELLVEAAKKGARAWEYLPARLDGNPIASFVQIPVNFRMQVQGLEADN